MSQKVLKLLIEGNIASGKTTFISYMNSSQSPLSDICQIFPEPLHLWRDVKGYNLLELFNKNPKKWTFLFESYVMLTMTKNHQQTIERGKSIKIMERSIYSAKYCFIDTLKEYGDISEPEFVVLNEWFEHLISNENYFDIDLIIYIKCNPEINMRRITHRGRSEEKNTSLEYLKILNDKYESWLGAGRSKVPDTPVITIDTCADMEKTLSEFDRGVLEIVEYYSSWASSK